MRTITGTMVFLLGLCAVGAFGQSRRKLLKGTWMAESAFCGKAIFKVDSVDGNGVVHGSFTCTNTKWTPTMGDAINKSAVKGTLSGNRFVMVNLDGGGVDLTLNGNKLEGVGTVKAGSPRNPITYTKQ